MRSALLAMLLLGGCAEAGEHREPPGLDPIPDPGLALVQRYECVRCHTMADGVPQADEHADCVGCHRSIDEGTFDAPADALSDWRAHVAPLTHTPSLRAIGARLRRSWIENFLLHPVDLRPGLVPSMPRLELSPGDAAAIARFLAPADSDPVSTSSSPSAVRRGRALYRGRACARCHAFTGSGEPPPTAANDTLAARLAPDLRFARARMRPDALVAWLQDPRRVDPDAMMPATELSREEARALAAFLVHTPLTSAAASSVPPRLPLLERAVSWSEVEARVFRRVCWHCHSDPDFALGDGGPGNHGGFGFAPRGVDLSSYEGVLAGGVDARGRARSVFRRGPDGTPRLVETLLARQREEAGEELEGIRGMPLGMPALSPEDIQLVETWIAQGRAM